MDHGSEASRCPGEPPAAAISAPVSGWRTGFELGTWSPPPATAMMLSDHDRAGDERTAEVIYELYGEHALVASTSDAATALLIAREWLRDPEQATTGIHTCVVQLRRGDELVGEHIVALAAGPLRPI